MLRFLQFGFILFALISNSAMQPAWAEPFRLLIVPFHYNEPLTAVTKSDGSVVNLQFNVPPRRTAQQWQTYFNNSTMLPNLNEFSYGKVDLSLTVLKNKNTSNGWYPAPHTVAEYFDTLHPSHGKHGPLNDILLIIAKMEIDIDEFDAIVAFGNQTTSGAATLPSFGKTGKPVILFNEIASDAEVISTLLHEIIHAIQYKAQIWDALDLYGSGQKLPDNTWPPSCGTSQRCMGTSATFSDDNFADWGLMGNHISVTHPSLRTKRLLGWIKEQDIYKRAISPSDSPFNDIVPLNAISKPGPAPLGVELRYSGIGEPLEAYLVECRRKIGQDSGIAKEGVLVTQVGVGKCGRPARVVSGSADSLNNICTAALNSTSIKSETVVDNARGLLIKGTAYNVDRCLVEISFVGAVRPDPAFGFQVYKKAGDSDFWGSADIWIDTLANGNQGYPAWQKLDADGAPDGQGDYPLDGIPAKIFYRLQNKGGADAHNIKVEVNVKRGNTHKLDSSHCSPGGASNELKIPEEVIGDALIGTLKAGESVIRSVNWTPKFTGSTQITVQIINFTEYALDINKANNKTRETVIVQNSNPIDPSLEQDIVEIRMTNPCIADRLAVYLIYPNPLFPKPTPKPLPAPYDELQFLSPGSNWAVSPREEFFSMRPLEEKTLAFRVTPKRRGARGAYAVPIGAYISRDGWPNEASGLESPHKVESFPALTGEVVEASSLRCASSRTRLRDLVQFKGRLFPRLANEAILFKVVSRSPRVRGQRVSYQEARTNQRGGFKFELHGSAKSAMITAIWPGNLEYAAASTRCSP